MCLDLMKHCGETGLNEGAADTLKRKLQEIHELKSEQSQAKSDATLEEKVDRMRTRDREFRKEVLDTFEMLEKHLGVYYIPSVEELRKKFT